MSPQARSLHANDGTRLWVFRVIPLIHGLGDGVSLYPAGASLDRFVNHESQKLLQAGGIGKYPTGQHALQFLLQVVSRCGRVVAVENALRFRSLRSIKYLNYLCLDFLLPG
jgi:hypothetical protein